MLDERERKLIRLALDAGATPGEAQAAFGRFVELLRKRGVKAQELIDRLDARAAASSHQAPPHPPPWTTPPPRREPWGHSGLSWKMRLMPFGQYRGQTLYAIAQSDPQYIRWLFEEADIRRGWLKTAIAEAVDYIDGAEDDGDGESNDDDPF